MFSCAHCALRSEETAFDGEKVITVCCCATIAKTLTTGISPLEKSETDSEYQVARNGGYGEWQAPLQTPLKMVKGSRGKMAKRKRLKRKESKKAARELE